MLTGPICKQNDDKYSSSATEANDAISTTDVALVQNKFGSLLFKLVNIFTVPVIFSL